MPWLLIVLVAGMTAAAVEFSTVTARLAALGMGEAIIVVYFGVAMYRLRRSRIARQAQRHEAGMKESRSPV